MIDYTAKMNEVFGCNILDFDDVDTSDLFKIMDYFDDYCLDWF